MKDIITISNLRKFLLSKIEHLTVNQLNYVPDGYSNNIIWNLAHMNAVLQKLCYEQSGLPIRIEEKYFGSYLSGTFPEASVDEAEIIHIKALFLSSVDTLLTDYENSSFKQYTQVEKIEEVYHLQVSDINDALSYLHYHEGVHHGMIFSLMKLVPKLS